MNEWTLIMVLNATVIIILGLVFILKLRKERKSGFPSKDERTAKIHGKAAIGAFWVSYIFMLSILMWIIFGNELLALPELETGWTIIAIMLVSAITYAFLSWFYGRKGDI